MASSRRRLLTGGDSGVGARVAGPLSTLNHAASQPPNVAPTRNAPHARVVASGRPPASRSPSAARRADYLCPPDLRVGYAAPPGVNDVE